MRNRFAWSCCAVLVLGSSPPPAHEAADLRAIKPWDLDYGEAQCTAMREYGDAADPVTLAIIPAFDGSSYRLVVAYKRRSPDAPDEFLGKIDFGSGPISAWAMKYGTEDRKLTLYQYRVDAAEMALARTAQRLTLHLRGAPDATFSLENTPELLDGLQKCTADLQDFWNFGGERNGRIAVPSKKSTFAMISIRATIRGSP